MIYLQTSSFGWSFQDGRQLASIEFTKLTNIDTPPASIGPASIGTNNGFTSVINMAAGGEDLTTKTIKDKSIPIFSEFEIKDDKLIWNGSFDEDLKQLFSSAFELNGKWSSPGGDIKLHKSDETTVKWHGPTKKIITILKDNDRQGILNKLEDLAKRNQADKAMRSQQHNILDDSVILQDMDLIDCLNTELIDAHLTQRLLLKMEGM